jgi:hypothetical protein
VKACLSRSVEVRILCQSIGVFNTAVILLFVVVWVGFIGVIYWSVELQAAGDWQPILGKYIRPYKAMHYKAIRFIRSSRPSLRSYRLCKALWNYKAQYPKAFQVCVRNALHCWRSYERRGSST